MSTTTEQTEPFGTQILHNATFRVKDWTRKVAKGEGTRTYSAPCILAEIKGYIAPIWVELTRSDYDNLRLLKMQGINTFACSLGMKGVGERYAPRIYSGAKDW